MHHKSIRFLGIMLAGLVVLTGCGQTEGSSSEETPSTSSSSASVDIGEYYNAENFVVDEKKVTETKLVTYDGPSMMNSSSAVDVSVNGHNLFVYETRVNHGRVFSWNMPKDMTQAVIFDFEGKVHLDITIKDPNVVVESALVRPLVYGIPVSVSNNVISFDLESNGNYVVEYNNDPKTAIQIFANEIEKNPITEEEAAKDPNILYVGPGVYKADSFPMHSHQTIYLAGGSYVYGQFSTEGLEDITIRGRGIVSGSIYSRASASEYLIPVVMRRVKNLRIEDVAFFDPAGWAIHLWKCEDVYLKNLKIITARSNGDGISVQSCSNVEVDGGYVRTWDDSLVVKNSDRGITDHVNIHDVIVWTDLAQSMEVGYETYGATMNDIVFNNITVVHNFHKAVISLHNCDDAHITNVKYSNITVEDGQMLGDDRDDGENDFLIDFTIAYNAEWSKSADARGSVDGVTIENVKVYSMLPTIKSRMLGEAPQSAIKNVKIKGLEIAGKMIEKASDIGLATNEYVENVTFETQDKVLGRTHKIPYTLALANEEVAYANHKNIEQNGMIVPEFARMRGELAYIGEKSSAKVNAEATHGAGNKTKTPGDDGTGPFLAEGSSADYAFDGNPDTYYQNGEWRNEDYEFATLTANFAANSYIGVIRIKGRADNVCAYNFSIQVWTRRLKTDGTMSDTFLRSISSKTYTMSPSKGNCIDINIPANEYGGIQLRFDRSEDITAPKFYEIGEIEFYPPSLTYGKSIVESTTHNDVYPVDKVVDGDPTGTSYYESKGLPATIVIDLGDVYHVSVLVLCLPPDIKWGERTQNIEISMSDSANAYSSSTPFTVATSATDMNFNAETGNRVLIHYDNLPCRFLKIVISSNTASGGYGGQLSEVSLYGTK